MIPVVLVSLLFGAAQLWGFKDFIMPKAENASTYPSKDSQPNEKITVAVDPYNSAPKDDIFNTHFMQEGILPVFLVITNDSDKPISLTKMNAQLITSNRAKLDALAGFDWVLAGDILLHTLHPLRAAASAASQPAWPAPMTITS